MRTRHIDSSTRTAGRSCRWLRRVNARNRAARLAEVVGAAQVLGMLVCALVMRGMS